MAKAHGDSVVSRDQNSPDFLPFTIYLLSGEKVHGSEIQLLSRGILANMKS